MKKWMFTFGCYGLPELGPWVEPLKTIVVVDGNTEYEARKKVLDSFIGRNFSTDYPYEKKDEIFRGVDVEEINLEDAISMTGRWPWTYAYDYLREVASNGNVSSKISRSDASRIIDTIANAMGVDNIEIAKKLAGEYVKNKRSELWE